MIYKVELSKQAQKDFLLLSPKLKKRFNSLIINSISKNPYLGKKLQPPLEECHSYRLNLKDRIVYNINKDTKTVYIKRARTHYGE